MICSVGRSFVLQVAKGRTPKRPISVSFQHQRYQHASRETTPLSVSHRAPFRQHAFSTLNTNSNSSSSNNTLQNQNRGGSILRASTLSAASAVVDDSVNQQMKTTGSIGIKQLFDDESSTYTYLLWDETTKDALLVDPVDTQVDRDLQEVNALGLNLVYAINTHAHADHITGTGILKQVVPGLESVISENSGAAADLTIHHGDQIFFGHHHLVVRATPGHTLGCVSLVAGDGSFVLTGDTLLVQGCGRTDFQGGSSETLWESVQTQLFSLPDTTTVYPAHDYKGRTHTTIGAEKETNPRLGGDNTKEDFVEIMNNLNLPYPKKLDVAVPANMRCGIQDDDGDI